MATLLRESLLEVNGQPDSPAFTLDIGLNGAVVGKLKVRPVATPGGFELDVRYAEAPTAESLAREIRDAVGAGELISVYYESGHAFTAQQISRQKLSSTPFPNIRFP